MGSSRARDLYGRGKYAEAAAEAARILAVNPSDPGAYAVLQMANAKLDAQRIAFAGAADDEENTRRAVKHWHTGIIYFQAGKYAKARDEWLLCKQFDAANEDCQTGLARLDSTYGGGS
jgi:tetratricopeptide (TPR) repeat protein